MPVIQSFSIVNGDNGMDSLSYVESFDSKNAYEEGE